MTLPEPLLSLSVDADGQATLSHRIPPDDAAQVLEDVARAIREGKLNDCSDPNCPDLPAIASES